MNKKLIFLVLASILGLGIIVFNSSPKNSPLILIVVPVILIGIVVGGTCSLVARILNARDRAWRVFLPIALGMLASLFIVMTSLNQLSLATGTLLFAFITLLVFYLAKMKK